MVTYSSRHEAYLLKFSGDSLDTLIQQCKTSEKVKIEKHKSGPILSQNFYVADTETSRVAGTEGEVRVYLWAVYGQDKKGIMQTYTGTHVKTLIDTLFILDSNRVYFHNAKYDLSYIMSYILRYGGVDDYSGLISDDGLVYKVDLTRTRPDGKTKHLIIMDSFKLLNQSVKKLGHVVGIEKKTEDAESENVYNKVTNESYTPTEKEIDYCITDCKIVYTALQSLPNVKTMTISGYARKLLKAELNKFAVTLGLACPNDYNAWRAIWPQFNRATQEILQFCYKGGWVYANPNYVKPEVPILCESYDVNSHYPAIMSLSLPYGGADKNGCGYWRLPQKDDWYMVIFDCSFWPRPPYDKNPIPTVRIKASPFHSNDRWYSESYETVRLGMTKEEFIDFQEHYNFILEGEPHYLCFPQSAPYLHDLIERMGETKTMYSDMIQECLDKGDIEQAHVYEGLKNAEKIKLNALYGTTGQNSIRGRAEYVLDEKGLLRMGRKTWEVAAGVYTPVACFITALGRIKIQRHWWAHYNDMIYSDTDSVKVKYGFKWPESEIDGSKFGYFKPEYTDKYNNGHYIYPIREKEYITMFNDCNNNIAHKVKFAGLSEKAQEDFYFNVFCANGHSVPDVFTVQHCLMQRPMIGGTLLCEEPKTIDLNSSNAHFIF